MAAANDPFNDAQLHDGNETSNEIPEAAVAKLKRSRSGYMSKLTIIYKEITELTSDAVNENQILELRAKLDVAFDKFISCHTIYKSTLKPGSDATLMADESFMNQTSERDKFISHLNHWLLSCTAANHNLGAAELKSLPDDVAQKKRCVSTTSSTKAMRMRLELKMEHLRRRQDLQNKAEMLKLQQEFETAALEDSLKGDDDQSSVVSNCSGFGLDNVFRTRLEDENSTKPKIPISLETAPLPRVQEARDYELRDAVLAMTRIAERRESYNDSPKPDMKRFNGDPMQYNSFIHAFMTHFDSKQIRKSKKLSFLIQFSEGKALRSINECTMWDDDGYDMALKILFNQFGRPHLISQAYIDGLVKGGKLRSGDYDELQLLSTNMIKCKLALTKLGYNSDINNSSTLEQIVLRLPLYLQSQWALRANEINTRNREASFTDLCDFVELNAQVSNSRYGRIIGKSNEKSDRKTKDKFKPKGRNVNAVISNQNATRIRSCLFCNLNHHVTECKEFNKLDYDKRYEFTRKRYLCDNCLNAGHLARKCRKDRSCKINDCTYKHHELLHPPKDHVYYSSRRSQSQTNVNQIFESESNSSECNACVNAAVLTENKTCLKTVPLLISSNNKHVKTYALLDSGSDSTLCTEDVAKALGLTGYSTNCKLNTFDNKGPKKIVNKYQMNISPIDGNNHIRIHDVIGVKHIHITQNSIARKHDVKRLPYLKDITINELDDKSVGLLIGTNIPEAFWVLDQRINSRNDPVAIKTIFGWSIVGPINKYGSDTRNVNFVCNDDKLHENLERFWKTDFPNDDDRDNLSKDEKQALRMVNESYRIDNGHYKIGLPWKINPEYLHGNRPQAIKRLYNLRKRLMQNHKLKNKYCSEMQKYIDDGYARKVGDEVNQDKCWFIPHHPVLHKDKPDKLRIVFDCAANYNGLCLNKFIFQGPDIVNSMTGVLMRFRQHPVVIIGDVQAMFHQVKLDEKDWNKLSFLWWDKCNFDEDPCTYQMTVHPFGATSSPFCAAFALQKTALDNAEKYSKLAVDTIKNSFYVDDCITSVTDDATAIGLYYEVKSLLYNGGFTMRKWISNSKTVMDIIPEDERAKSSDVFNLELDKSNEHKALGVLWEVSSDVITFSSSLPDRPFTRRGVLSARSTLFDPLGFISPICLIPKLLLQDLCRKRFGWDTPLNDSTRLKWLEWTKSIKRISNIRIPRCYAKLSACSDRAALIQLHCFSDASTLAYGAVCYLRIVSNNQIECSFVFGKSRLAPIKTTTVPRLELCAAVVSAELGSIIQRELDLQIAQVYYWTDSSIVLHYLQNNSSRYKTFVANRITKILEKTEQQQWRHVNGIHNPADDASRGLAAQDLCKENRWLEGPEFLYEAEDKWPAATSLDFSRHDLELSKSVNVVTDSTTPTGVQRLLQRYSSFDRLVKAIAWIRKFIEFRKDKTECGKRVTADDLNAAENAMIRYEQRIHFNEQVNCSDGTVLRKCNKKLLKLHPVLIDGILRVGGRLRNAPISESRRYPAILHQSHFTELLIRHHHVSNGHIGSSQTWTSLRERYWIVGGSNAVRRTIGNCVFCKRRNFKPVQQMMADLPEVRVTPGHPPFWNVGLDFFGPFLVKQGRKTVKRYGCIYTCLATRAVHIELADSLDVSSFLNCFRRFCSRRGQPDAVFSDNGRNFIAAERTLKEEIARWNKNAIENFMLSRRISWHFNPPYGAHMGGCWERLVKSVKRILNGLLNNQTLYEDVLHTTLVEVEYILNSRPLFPISLDCKAQEPLTPNHLLLMRSNDSLPPGVFEKDDLLSQKRWKHARYLVDVFWKRWVQEYLPTLQIRSKWQLEQRNLHEGDIVIMHQSIEAKKFVTGKVIKIYPDHEGKVRQVDVKTGHAIYKRPISKLCLIQKHEEKLTSLETKA